MERPIFIGAGDETLFGILAEPSGDALGVAAIHLRGGNQGPSSGRNRTSADLCRRLAATGLHALRFDYHGVGESTGSLEVFRHDQPFRADIEACLAWLGEHGIERTVLIGECFGARTALAAADLPGVEAMVLVAVHVRDAEKDERGGTRALVRHRTLMGYARRAFRSEVLRGMLHRDRRRQYVRAAKAAVSALPAGRAAPHGQAGPGWVSTAFVENLETALHRGIRVLFVNGREDPGFEDFQRARDGQFGQLLQDAGTGVHLEFVDGRVGAWADARVQDPTLRLITTWLSTTVDPEGSLTSRLTGSGTSDAAR